LLRQDSTPLRLLRTWLDVIYACVWKFTGKNVGIIGKEKRVRNEVSMLTYVKCRYIYRLKKAKRARILLYWLS
jgi:hypothetical protein